MGLTVTRDDGETIDVPLEVEASGGEAVARYVAQDGASDENDGEVMQDDDDEENTRQDAS